MVPDSSRLEDPELIVLDRGEEAGPGERGWGVPERNIPVRCARSFRDHAWLSGSVSICLSRSVCVSLSVWSADRICFDLHSQNLNIGVKPMSDVTPDHKYDINDPFGEWTMSQELAKSPREYRCVRACCR